MQTLVINITDPAADLPEALSAAAAFSAPDDAVHLFHALYHPGLDVTDRHPSNDALSEARELLIAARRKALTAAGGELPSPPIVHVAWAANGWQSLCQYAREHDAALVIAHSQRRKGWQRIGRTNDDWQLIRHCHAPLLLTRDATRDRYRTILAAIDPLHADDKPDRLDREILQQAAILARRHSADLKVLNVVAPITQVATGTSVPALAVQPVEAERLDLHREHVTGLVKAADCDDAEVIVVPGVPSHVIVEEATRRGAGLVVMGAVSRSLVRNVLIGSTAERVLDRLDADSLIIKPAAG